MNTYYRYAACLLLAVVFAVVAGCSAPVASEPPAKGAYLTVQDDAGRTVSLPKRPERIVPLSSSLLDLVYAVGGTAVGKPSSKTATSPAAAQTLPEIGHVSNINVEQLLGLRPDLVIGLQGRHEKLIPVFESSKIPIIMIKMKTYEDVQDKIKLFGDLCGTSDQAASVAAGMRSRIQAIIDKTPAAAKAVVILHATSNSVTVQLEHSIAGSIAQMLRLKNIAAGSAAGQLETVPYSMEKLLEGDPDVVLITYMGDMPKIEKRLQADVSNNPAWSGLRAVKNQQVFFLPMDLFLLNPGIQFDEAVLYMAQTVYPEIYSGRR